MSWLPTIISLLLRCRPFAVFWLVIAVVIYSIQCLSFGPLAHISDKVLDRIKPSVTDCYAPAPVSVIPCVFRVKAATAHCDPALILPSPAKTMRSPSSTHSLLSQAAAGSDVSGLEIAKEDEHLVAAGALTTPLRPFSFGPLDKLNQCQSTINVTFRCVSPHGLHYKTNSTSVNMNMNWFVGTTNMRGGGLFLGLQ